MRRILWHTHQSPRSSTIVKYAGAVYLIYLGLRTLLSGDRLAVNSKAIANPVNRGNAFYQGIITEILNPKTALFFLSFIPQFIRIENGHVFTQFLILGLITILFNFAADFMVVTFAGLIEHKLRTNYRLRQGQRIMSGCTLIGLGTYVAVADSN